MEIRKSVNRKSDKMNACDYPDKKKVNLYKILVNIHIIFRINLCLKWTLIVANIITTQVLNE